MSQELTDLDRRIIDFVAAWTGTPQHKVALTTRLVDGVSIWGDDADDFLIDFGKQFNVDVLGFPRVKNFGQEGASLTGFVRGVVKQLRGESTHEPQLTVADLVRAAQTGRFDMDCLNDCQLCASDQGGNSGPPTY
jgi:hypothetical protein